MINPALLEELAQANIHNKYMESKLFLSAASIHQISARELADLAFVSAMALFVCYYQASTRRDAANYAAKVVEYINVNNDFSAKRIMANDLYLVFHGLSNENDSMVSDKLRPNTQTPVVWSKVKVNVPKLRKFFVDMQQMSLDNVGFIHLFLYRLELDLFVNDSTLRDLRRSVQEWYKQTPKEKVYVIARLLTWMKTHANSMDLVELVQKLARIKDIELSA